MATKSPPTLEAVIGMELRTMREAAGITQDAVAASARQVGLTWARSSVAALERGTRKLSASELLLLPEIIAAAFGDDPSLADVIGAFDVYGKVDLEGVVVEWADLRSILEGRRVSGVAMTRSARRSLPPRVKEPWVRGETEQKAARKFGVSEESVDRAAIYLWRRPLTSERDRRVKEQAGETSSPRSMQALRGHITRTLLEELEPVIRSGAAEIEEG